MILLRNKLRMQFKILLLAGMFANEHRISTERDKMTVA